MRDDSVDQDQFEGGEDEEDLILSELSDEDLVEQMHDDLYDGLKEEIEEGTHILLDRGWAPDSCPSGPPLRANSRPVRAPRAYGLRSLGPHRPIA